MKSTTIRRWSFIHTWTSLICTLFLLMLAITGLPLVFHHEIEHLLGDEPQFRDMPADTPQLDLQQLVQAAQAHRPGEVVQYFGWDEDDPHGVFAITAATADTEPNLSHTFMLDNRTGEAMEMPSANSGFMMVMLRLHVDMYAGLPGKLLLAFMGLLFVLAIVSGVVLYSPFMRKLSFGTVRNQKSTRTRWLDLHNLIGVVTLTWALVVGVTGVISACADLLISAWRAESLTALIEPYRDAPPLTQRAPASRLLDIAHGAAPGMTPDFIAFPGTRFSQRTPLRGIHEGRHPPDFAPADACADRCHHPGRHGSGRTALVHGCHGPVAAAALRRLRRHADADSVGGAGCADHHRAEQRRVPVVGPPPRHQGRWRGGCGVTKRKKSTFWPVFGIPLAIGLIGAAGLFAALLGDGWWDALAWVGLGIPAVLGGWGLVRRD